MNVSLQQLPFVPGSSWLLLFLSLFFLRISVVASSNSSNSSTTTNNTSEYCFWFEYTQEDVNNSTAALSRIAEQGFQYVNESFVTASSSSSSSSSSNGTTTTGVLEVEALNWTLLSYDGANDSEKARDLCSQASSASSECGLVSAELCVSAPSLLEPRLLQTVSYTKIRQFLSTMNKNNNNSSNASGAVVVFQGPLEVKTRLLFELQGAKRYLSYAEKHGFLNLLYTAWSQFLPQFPIQSMMIVLEQAMTRPNSTTTPQQRRQRKRRQLIAPPKFQQHRSKRILLTPPRVPRHLQYDTGDFDTTNVDTGDFDTTNVDTGDFTGNADTGDLEDGVTGGSTTDTEDTTTGESSSSSSGGSDLEDLVGSSTGDLEDVLTGSGASPDDFQDMVGDFTGGSSSSSSTGGNSTGSSTGGMDMGDFEDVISGSSGGGAVSTEDLEDLVTGGGGDAGDLQDLADTIPEDFPVDLDTIPINTIEVLIAAQCEGTQECSQENLEEILTSQAANYIGEDGSILLDQLQQDAEANFGEYFDDVFNIVLDQVGMTSGTSAAVMDINITELLSRAQTKVPPMKEPSTTEQSQAPEWVGILIFACFGIVALGFLFAWQFASCRTRLRKRAFQMKRRAEKMTKAVKKIRRTPNKTKRGPNTPSSEADETEYRQLTPDQSTPHSHRSTNHHNDISCDDTNNNNKDATIPLAAAAVSSSTSPWKTPVRSTTADQSSSRKKPPPPPPRSNRAKNALVAPSPASSSSSPPRDEESDYNYASAYMDGHNTTNHDDDDDDEQPSYKMLHSFSQEDDQTWDEGEADEWPTILADDGDDGMEEFEIVHSRSPSGARGSC